MCISVLFEVCYDFSTNYYLYLNDFGGGKAWLIFDFNNRFSAKREGTMFRPGNDKIQHTHIHK